MGKKLNSSVINMFFMMIIVATCYTNLYAENKTPKPKPKATVTTFINGKLEVKEVDSLGEGTEQENFFLSCQGVPVWQVFQQVSHFYKVNVLVFDDIKDKLIYSDISGVDLKETLNIISWLLGVEWIEDNGQYYIGGNQKLIKVFQSSGIDGKIESVYASDSVKLLNDKIIVQGTERDITRVSESLLPILNRKSTRAKIKVIEVVYNDSFTIGLDWEKSFEYGVRWDNMLKNVHPATHLAMSAAASVQLDQAVISSKFVVDTEIGIISGSPIDLQVGDETDREIYNQDENGNRVISGYDTQTTGLLIKLNPYYIDKKSWIFDCNFEHSRPISDTQKTLNKVINQVQVDSYNPYLLASVSTDGGVHNISQGIPFLSRIPIIGILFSVTEQIKTRKDFYVVLKLVETDKQNLVEPEKISPYYWSLDDFLNQFQ